MRLGSLMKKIGSFILFSVSFLAFMLTWQVEVLSPLGGIFITGISLSGAILMWLDAQESVRISGKQDAGRAKTDR
ncbi:hypothetical protein [Paenibacillus sedimenti]|uniref:Uncharacterized protein n=1 Tax=Paenibacillus sedimenti TaxID=2770274 RepID=A0A926KSN5_9BACL|nr:hypothetical protein [Paenibacillus sedimenti]MBD0382593.1 hypothetical protein [Paenibacillus sedimenti]